MAIRAPGLPEGLAEHEGCQGQLASSPKPRFSPQDDFGMQETERKPHPCGWPRARHGEPTATPWLNLSATQAHGRAVLEGKHLKTTLQPPEHPPGPSAAGEGAASPRKEVGGEAAGRGCPGPASARPSNQAEGSRRLLPAGGEVFPEERQF